MFDLLVPGFLALSALFLVILSSRSGGKKSAANTEKPAGLETQTYTNNDYHFSIEVPKDWCLSENFHEPNIHTFKWCWKDMTSAKPSFGVYCWCSKDAVSSEESVMKHFNGIYGEGSEPDRETVREHFAKHYDNVLYVIYYVTHIQGPDSFLETIQYCTGTFQHL
jgi:hypothetical protein